MSRIKTKYIEDLAITNAKIANTTIDLTTKVTGSLPVANGGTGTNTLTANNVILGNGTSAVNFVAPSTSGNVLTSNGTTWTSTAPSAASPTIFGSRGTPRSIVAATGITSGASHMSTSAVVQDIYVEGSIAGNSVAATISAGTIDGQRMTLIGRNNSNTVSLTTATTNLYLNGDITLGLNAIVTLRWDTSEWVEVSRNG